MSRVDSLDPITAAKIEASMHVPSFAKVIEILLCHSLQSPRVTSISISADPRNNCIELQASGTGLSERAIEEIGYGRADIDYLVSICNLHIHSVIENVYGNFSITKAFKNASSSTTKHSSSSHTGTSYTASNIFTESFYCRQNMEVSVSEIHDMLSRVTLPYYSTTLKFQMRNQLKSSLIIPSASVLLDRFVNESSSTASNCGLVSIRITSDKFTMSGYASPIQHHPNYRNEYGTYAYVDSAYNESLTSILAAAYSAHTASGMKRKHMDESQSVFSPSFVLMLSSLSNQPFQRSDFINAYKLFVTELSKSSPCVVTHNPNRVTPFIVVSTPTSAYLHQPHRSELPPCFDSLLVESDSSSPISVVQQSTPSDHASYPRLTVTRPPSTRLDDFDRKYLYSEENADISPSTADETVWDEDYRRADDFHEDYGATVEHEQIEPDLDLESVQAEHDADMDFMAPFALAPRKLAANPATSIAQSIRKSDLAACKVIGQFDSKFILLLHSDSDSHRILCLDQHAAHERVLLESFELPNAATVSNTSACCTSQSSSSISLSRSNAATLQLHEDLFEQWGFQWTLASDNVCCMSVCKTPVILGEQLSAADFHEFIVFVENNRSLPSPAKKPPALARILASKACRSAIKFGDTLTSAQSTALVASLSGVCFPFQCAHGRPSLVPLLDVRASHDRRAALSS